MPIRRFPKADPTQKYVMAGDIVQRMFDALAQDGNLTAAPPLLIADGPGGKTISLALPPGASLLRLTSTATGAGTYNARVQQVTATTQSSATDLSLVTWYGDLQTSDDAIVENISENQATAGTHALSPGANTFVIGWLTGRFASDAANRPIYTTQQAGGLPQSTGIYKVLMLIDNSNPGTPGWDYPSFHV